MALMKEQEEGKKLCKEYYIHRVLYLDNAEDLLGGTLSKGYFFPQPPENVITLVTSRFRFKSSQMMYGRGAPTWHMLIDRGVMCGYFLHSSTRDLEFQSSAQTPPSINAPASSLYGVSKICH